jgi:Uncharacterized protein involved in cation transport
MLVFAYGSLLWRPGFKPKASTPAVATGWRRSWCVESRVHRGTSEMPGIVLGLVEGGRCSGVAYSVESSEKARVAEYLSAREMAEQGYRPEMIEVETPEGIRAALAYVSDPGHRINAPAPTLFKRIMTCRGSSGTNVEYAARTFASIRELNDELTDMDAGLPRAMVSTIRTIARYNAVGSHNYANRLTLLREPTAEAVSP